MGTKVKVRQDFGQTPGTALAPPLETCLVGPINRSITRALAGRYDTTDATETCYPLPELGVGTTPNLDVFGDVYSDPVFYNSRYPDLTVDAERHLSNILDNRDAFRFFREGHEDRPELTAANGGWADDEIFQTFHPNLVPGSIVIAKKVTFDIDLDGGDDFTYIPTANFPQTEGSSFRADGVIAGTVKVNDPNTGTLVYQEGTDYKFYYDFDASPGGGNTRWVIERIPGGQLSLGVTVEVSFEAKFPFKYGTELDVEVDYVNGSIQNKLGDDLHDAIFYYAFNPIVSLAAFLRERVSSQLTQLDGTDYTIKDVGGVTKLCVRPGRQGALLVRSGFTVTDTIKKGEFICGTKTEPFDVRGPCGSEPECDTLRVCVFDGTNTTTWDVVFNGPGGGPDPDNGDVNAQDIVDDINAATVGGVQLNRYVVAYESSGKVCIRLRDPDLGDNVTAPNEDMRGADRYFEIQPVARDFAPVLGLPYGRVCGHTLYELTDIGAEFQDTQDAFGNILGSVVIDVAGNRYRIDQIVTDDEILVTQVDVDGIEICGAAVEVPDGSGTYKVYYSEWSGEILLTYTASRSDLGDEILEIENGAEDVIVKLSEDGTQANFSAGPDNPGAYALSKMVFTNTTRSVLFLPTKGKDLTAFQNAIEVLELSERPHCLILLSASKDVTAAFADHVMAMSDPDETYEPQSRVVVGTEIVENAKVIGDIANDNAEVRASFNPSSRTYTSSTVDPVNYDAETGEAKIFRLVDGDGTTNVNFVTDGVAVGDRVRIHFGANKGDWKVLRILTSAGGTKSHELELTALTSDQFYKWDTDHSQNANPAAPVGLNQNGLVAYTIWRTLSKAQHVEAIKSIGSAYRGKKYPYRVTTTWGPLYVDDETPDGRSATLPGYFLNAALGGACASAPPQQGFTNYPLNGTSKILYSKGWFNNKQLDDIESAGVWIWQIRPGERYFHCRQQFTVTGYLPSESLSSQFHIIRIADRVHRRLWRALIGFTGVYNITPENISVFRMVIEAALESAKQSRAPRVGPEIMDGYVVKIECDKDQPRTLTVITRIIPPEAVDVFDITNQIRRG